MAEFYTWPEAGRLFLTLIITLSVLFQSLTVVFSFYRYQRSPGRVVENIFEVFVLLQILVSSLLHGQATHNYDYSFITPTGYGIQRIGSFIIVSLMAAIAIVMIKSPWPLFVPLAAAMVLPVMETAFGNYFVYLYAITMVFYLIRGIHISMLRYRKLKTNLSVLSIKYAIDSLNTGVLFSEPDGFIVLANTQMLHMMKAITGSIHRNGNYFYELLIFEKVREGCQKSELEEQMVYLLPDETAWMFTRTELKIGRKKYSQLTATDITQRWRLTAQLQEQENRLSIRQEELSKTIEDLHALSREKETRKAKMRAHDVLGQRLSWLLRIGRGHQALDYDLLSFFSQGLLEDLKADRQDPTPQDELETLRQTFGSIGVDIEVEGEAPKDITIGRIFTNIIREGVTNAVRHGFATKIKIHISLSNEGYHLRVTNNGFPPSKPIAEGGGIGGIRKMIEPYGGVLDVKEEPSFVIAVDLPRG